MASVQGHQCINCNNLRLLLTNNARWAEWLTDVDRNYRYCHNLSQLLLFPMLRKFRNLLIVGMHVLNPNDYSNNNNAS